MSPLVVLLLAVAAPVTPFFLSVEEAPVTVELYYESLCPGCREFLTTMLFPTFQKLQDTGIMKVALFPFGNAKEEQLPDGTWKFECQHGARECTGNILEACIMRHLDWDTSAYMPVISCMEGADDPVEAAWGCVRDLSKLDFKVVKECATGPEGNALLHFIAQQTEGLVPKHEFVPWIVINGAHNDTIQNEAQEDLLGYVCQLYKGSKPAECLQEVGLMQNVPSEKISRDYVEPQHQEQNEAALVEIELLID